MFFDTLAIKQLEYTQRRLSVYLSAVIATLGRLGGCSDEELAEFALQFEEAIKPALDKIDIEFGVNQIEEKENEPV
ncbi:MAG: hypothetical protein GTN64_05665 [Candidatus Latescibacteria bacterium]|nr:hypothetical protein [Candidatus Latescibacterota bacterium]NIO78097.1 hypothetical protein [Candidatus Latescibacterota bacterium]